MSLVVIGIGQTLRGDDAAGVLAVEAWQQAHPDLSQHPGIRVEICPLPGLHLLELLEDTEQAIIVDAVQSRAEPGSIHEIRVDDLASFAAGAGSAHGWGVAESLALANQLGLEDLPKVIHILGVEIENVELGEGLSPEVDRVLPKLVDRIQTGVESYLQKHKLNLIKLD